MSHAQTFERRLRHDARDANARSFLILQRVRPRRGRRGLTVACLVSAAAVLAVARIATAAGARGATTILFGFFVLAIGHFHSPFFALLEASESPYNLRTMVQSQALHSLTIGKLAAAGGVGVETIRFYQRRGLLDTPQRADGIRRYGSDDVRRLRFIRHAQAE